MKILLLEDVYKLGRAGDIKKVANGYGRNYLIPQGLAVLATPGAVSQADRIRSTADVRRSALNQELGGAAEQIIGQELIFPVRASETGRLYGSVTNRNIADMLNEKFNLEIGHRQIDTQPIRTLGVRQVPVRLTIDLVPEVTVIVHREGETYTSAEEAAAAAEAEAAEGAALEAEAEAEVAAAQVQDTQEASDDEVAVEAPEVEEAALEAEIADEAAPEAETADEAAPEADDAADED
jgi:large subunit ribosomal protein L9